MRPVYLFTLFKGWMEFLKGLKMFNVWIFIRLPYFDNGSILSCATIMYLISIVFGSLGAGGWGIEKLEGIF